MQERIVLKSNTYFDSVTLMSVTQQVLRLSGVVDAMVGMGTPLNMEILRDLGFQPALEAGPSDLLIALRGEQSVLDTALQAVEDLLAAGVKAAEVKSENTPQPARSLSEALQRQGGNLALISVPGTFAAREAYQALQNGLHVMLFSDNVKLEDEARLKTYAHRRGLLLMGPDCGTAIINGVPLAFANKVRRGVIGIVGASGTGIQEVSVQLDRLAQGVSQVIGTGGRDLSRQVGGIMMLDGIEALRQDPATKVIVVVSKPADPAIADKIYRALVQSGKPAVYCVIGDKPESVGHGNVQRAENLFEAARLAAAAAGPGEVAASESTQDSALAASLASRLQSSQKYVRGLFSGGTLCDEAMLELSQKLGLIYSNTPLDPQGKLDDPNRALQHTVLDLGDDRFTVGRPHPMIDFSFRKSRLIQEARDSEVGVILLDVVLGYGSNPDPAAELVPAILKARHVAAGHEPVIIAYVCGTEQDPQGYQQQVNRLRGCGVQVCPSNLAAARLAADIAALVQRRCN